MKYEVYSGFRINDDYSVFEFTSVGKNGSIPKRIEFTPTELSQYYNLAFGDIDEYGNINDLSISDNGDRNKILATIAYAVEIYLNIYPKRWVYFKGSTEERTRLYRMAVSLNLEELLLKFDIFAEQKERVLPFQKNIEILGILVRKK